DQARTAREIPHHVSVLLRHNLMIGGAASGQKELEFQEVTEEAGGLHAVLRTATLAEGSRLYQAITDPSYDAALVVRRAMDVAIPVAPPAELSRDLVSFGTGVIRGTWIFDF